MSEVRTVTVRCAAQASVRECWTFEVTGPLPADEGELLALADDAVCGQVDGWELIEVTDEVLNEHDRVVACVLVDPSDGESE